ncbi:hypothetical protein [Lactobacillus buchneri CD034] [Lactiplantibacillus mudanjiangensis]|uniref:pyocin knob domain-containing protein n=1 Tax=Lactiplantibacillus mudanjiangensis TaxID=1296538 RepID=UPI001014259B|nr:hypothetical protein [Lactobacillus buchneri CD034] [Lactiplantibacillus mudanjiangensis]
MATMNVGILTTAGKTLLDRVESGQTKITYSKMVFSSMDNGSFSDTQLLGLTLITPQEVVINDPQAMLDSTNGETKIRGNGDNSALSSGVYIKTYGVYAKDDDGNEILYGLTVSDHPNYLAPFDGLTPQAVTYTYKTTISRTEQVNFTNSTDVYLTDQDLKDAVSVLVTETDFTAAINSKQDKLNYTAADDAKVVHTTDSQIVNALQIRTFTGDFNTSNQTGIYNVPYIAGTYPNAPEGNIAGQLICITDGKFNAMQLLTDSARREWRRHLTSGKWQAWQRTASVTTDGDLNDSIRDVYLTKYGLGVADPINEYWNSFRNRLKWESRPTCAKGTNFGNFVKSNSVQTGFSIVRDDNDSANWMVIKESTDWIFGWAIAGGLATRTFAVQSGVYTEQAARAIKVVDDAQAADQARIDKLEAGTNANGANLNNYNTFGNYYSNTAVTNGPFGTETYVAWSVFPTANTILQVAWKLDGRTATRMYWTGSGWSAWTSHQGFLQASSEADAKAKSASNPTDLYYTVE